jgi:hypothetical protein
MAQRSDRHLGRRKLLGGLGSLAGLGGLAAIVELGSAGAVLAVSRRAWSAARTLRELGQRFGELRRRRRAHKPGQFDRDVEGWGGELHQVMTELGTRLGAEGTPGARVIEIMGEPDERKPQRWVYLWRGWHDYLYFEIVGDRVVRSAWYMAGE